MITIIRRATLEHDDRGGPYCTWWFGVGAIFEMGGNLFYSETPKSAGQAQSINNSIDQIVERSSCAYVRQK